MGALLLLLSCVCAVRVGGASTGEGSLDFRETGGGRYANLNVPDTGGPGLFRMDPEVTGLRFTNHLAASRSLTNHVLLNGSGVAAGDVDGDGWCDLYFCGLDGENVLYRNLGAWRFEPMPGSEAVACGGVDATGAVLVDVNGDHDLDLLVTSIGGGTRLFENDGKGRFREVTAASGLASGAASMSLTLADTDGDGDLDIYVTNYRTYTMRDAFSMRLTVKMVDGRPVVTHVNSRSVNEPDLAGRFSIDEDGNLLEHGEADQLFRNEGQHRFTLIPLVGPTFLEDDGRPRASPPQDWGLTAMFRDLNQDGAPDLYVCNDLGSPDRLWMNDGRGVFRPAPRLSLRKASWFSMGLDFADLNRDGFEEFMVTDMVSRDHRLRQIQVSDHQLVYARPGVYDDRPRTPRNTLFLNWGDGDYAEVAYYAGVEATEWSWAPLFLDVDLDGYEDLLVATGFERDVQDIDIAQRLEAIRQGQRVSDAEALRMRAAFPRLDLPNLAYRNRGDLTFEDMSGRWGFDDVGVSQGMATADLDNDGDLDVVVNNLNDAAGLYRNQATAPRVAVRLRGRAPNTHGVGARLELRGGSLLPTQSQTVISGGRYLSGDDGQRTFGAEPGTAMELRVRWPGGGTSRMSVEANHLYEMAEPEVAQPASQPAGGSPRSSTVFADLTSALGHRHFDAPFDDFVRQPLLPRKLSQLGPGVAWLDVDQDGWEDLAIGGGQGGRLSIYRNTGSGGFEPVEPVEPQPPLQRDQTALLGWLNTRDELVILAGSANYEDGDATGASVLEIEPRLKSSRQAIPGSASSTGPLVLADFDGDGDLDLFVGGRVVSGRYPEAASSRLYRREDGRWVEDREALAGLPSPGLVSGVVATDWDGDGYAELVLATEWGSLQLWYNERGRRFVDATDTLGLDRYRGWWNGVAAGDFDGDGRLDLLAANWGRNSRFQRHLQVPFRLYYGDFNGAGDTDLLEVYHDPAINKLVSWKHLGRVAPALPFIRRDFPTYRSFAEADVQTILGSRLAGARVRQVNWLATTLFLNRSDRAVARPLPAEAQLAPAFAVVVADFDGNGTEDAFLSQNFFPTDPELSRYDAGRGLLLWGDGAGTLSAVPARDSGIRVYGEQRGAAVADFDRDGRADLVVSQNSAETRLFRNTGARPGIRIRLAGPVGNPQGIGAVVRLGNETSFGPAREIHAGSGYWSQDSAVIVVQPPPNADRVRVQWPGGRLTTHGLLPEAREIVLGYGEGIDEAR